jgi:Mn-dependent DtxR family transcriptional regulator
MNLPRLMEAAPVDIASRLLISQSLVSDAISRLQQKKTRIQNDYDRRKADHDELRHRYDQCDIVRTIDIL